MDWSYDVAEGPDWTIGLCGLTPAKASSPFVCLYLPGRYGNSDCLLTADADDVRVHLALAGIPLYSLDYRTHFVDPSDPMTVAGCSSWGTTNFLDDVAAAVAAVAALARDRALAIIGHSLGAKLAYLYAARGPIVPDAIVVLDGWLRAPQPMRSEIAGLRHEIERWRSGAIPVYKTTRWRSDSRSTVRALARETAAGRLSTFPDGEQDVLRLSRLLATYDHYWPVRQTLELRAASLGVTVLGLERFDDDLGTISGRLLNVIADARGGGYAVRSRYTAGLLRAASRTELAIADFGHLDVVASGRARDAVAIPIARWLCAAS